MTTIIALVENAKFRKYLIIFLCLYSFTEKIGIKFLIPFLVKKF